MADDFLVIEAEIGKRGLREQVERLLGLMYQAPHPSFGQWRRDKDNLEVITATLVGPGIDEDLTIYVDQKHGLAPAMFLELSGMTASAQHTQQVYFDLDVALEKIFLRLRGDEAEVRLDVKREPGLLTGWHDDFGSGTPHTEKYVSQVHPYLRQTIADMPEYRRGRGFVVADIFCGDGSFIRGLHDWLKDPSMSFIMADGSHGMLPDIQRNFGTGRGYQGEGVYSNVSWSISDLTRPGAIYEELGEGIDVVTANGGINLKVVHRDDAFGIARQVYDCLKPKGYFIVTGFTHTHLNSQDFHDIGFDVINMTVPKNVTSSTQSLALGSYPRQYYILQKP